MVSRVIVAGHLCVDLSPSADRLPVEPGQLWEVGPLGICTGGSVSNTGRGLAALGHEVSISALVGDDALGQIATAQLAAIPGITGAPAVVPGGSTSYSIVIEPTGVDRTFWHHTGVNDQYDGTGDLAIDADLVHLGYPSLLPRLLEAGAFALFAFLQRSRAAGATTSLDLAVVTPGGTTDWWSVFQKIMPMVDIISPSADDLRSALQQPAATAEELADLLVRWGAGVAVVTDGSRGTAFACAGQSRLDVAGRALAPLAAQWARSRFHTPAPHLSHIVTTNGAGDTATAGLLSAILDGHTPSDSASAAIDAAAAHLEGRPLRETFAELGG